MRTDVSLGSTVDTAQKAEFYNCCSFDAYYVDVCFNAFAVLKASVDALCPGENVFYRRFLTFY